MEAEWKANGGLMGMMGMTGEFYFPMFLMGMMGMTGEFLMGMLGMIGEFHWFDGDDDLDKNGDLTLANILSF